MAKQLTYAIEPGGPKRLTIDSRPMWENCQIFFDGAIVGTIPNFSALMAGLDFPLPDGSTLRVLYTNKFLIGQFHVLRNGKPLPGSESDPNVQLRNACLVLYLVGVYDVVVGLLVGLFNVKLLASMGVTIWSSLIGAIFLLLAYLTSRGAKTALVLAIGLFLVDTLVSVYLGHSLGVDFMIRLVVLIPMALGLGGINSSKKQEN
jgi:hypothetical protein